jgi:hypothetical protein
MQLSSLGMKRVTIQAHTSSGVVEGDSVAEVLGVLEADGEAGNTDEVTIHGRSDALSIHAHIHDVLWHNVTISGPERTTVAGLAAVLEEDLATGRLPATEKVTAAVGPDRPAEEETSAKWWSNGWTVAIVSSLIAAVAAFILERLL